MIRVLVADDHPLVRGGIVMLLTAQDDIEVVGEAKTGAEALQLAATLLPNVVLMDLRMPDLDGATATRKLLDDPPDPDHLPLILMLTTYSDDEAVYQALRSGASGFVTKDSAPTQLVMAIRAVVEQGSWLDPGIAGQVIDAVRASNFRGAQASSELVQRLTPREREVLCLLAQGFSAHEISSKLFLSEATVKTHIARILIKTGCRDRAQAVTLAYQSGLVNVGGRSRTS